jgi:hypothetical protein
MELEFEGSDGKLEAATGVELGSDGVELGAVTMVELRGGNCGRARRRRGGAREWRRGGTRGGDWSGAQR